MDIQKIKDIALQNGFSLKEQASGNMDLHSYVYEFAQAIEQEALTQARSIFNQEAVTHADTELLDAEITQASQEYIEAHVLDNDEAEGLEMLIAKSMKLGELYERMKWQVAYGVDSSSEEKKKDQIRIRRPLNDTQLHKDALALLGGCAVTEIRTLTGDFNSFYDLLKTIQTVEELNDFQLISIILVDSDNSDQLGEEFDWDEVK